MPTSYNEKEEYFRGAWVTSICDDFKPTPDKEQMKANLLKVISYFEKMNMNAIVYHVRTFNNAYYRTKLAPIDSNYGTYESFEEWDYLKWFIDECHSRGIEFHAWLNPYRIKVKGFPEGYKEKDIANLYKDCPSNPASNPENILLNDSTGAILNPCKEEVQKYIIDVCLELMSNYNIDAIHFDDYFYAKMTEKNEALLEDDQKDYVEYIKNNPNCGYKVDSEKDKKDWRRENVDKFIHDLSVAMRKFNKENNRQVQLGISPTGIYMNGDGEVTYDENHLPDYEYKYVKDNGDGTYTSVIEMQLASTDLVTANVEDVVVFWADYETAADYFEESILASSVVSEVDENGLITITINSSAEIVAKYAGGMGFDVYYNVAIDGGEPQSTYASLYGYFPAAE